MKVKVHEAGLHDRYGAKLLLDDLNGSVPEDEEDMV